MIPIILIKSSSENLHFGYAQWPFSSCSYSKNRLYGCWA